MIVSHPEKTGAVGLSSTRSSFAWFPFEYEIRDMTPLYPFAPYQACKNVPTHEGQKRRRGWGGARMPTLWTTNLPERQRNNHKYTPLMSLNRNNFHK